MRAQPRQPYGPEQAKLLNADGLSRARSVISAWPGYAFTPLLDLPGIAAHAGIKALHYKDEGQRFGLKSFKPLGGAYAVAQLLLKEITGKTSQRKLSVSDLLSGAYRGSCQDVTVTAATDGNHGRSVAWGARMFGCRCVIFINESVSIGREHAIAAFGAEVRRNPGSYDDAVRAAQETADAQGWHVIADTSDGSVIEAPRNVMQGYAVMAAEAIEQLPYAGAPTHLFLQAGVGGMAAASCAQFWQEFELNRPTVIVIEPDNAACWFASLKAGKPVTIDGDVDSLMGGLSCGEISRLAWDILKIGTDATMTLPDEAAAEAMRLLAEGRYGDKPLVAGESGVAGLAGLLAVASDPRARRCVELDENSNVVLFGTEGATDPDTYARIVGQSPEEVMA